MPRMLSPIEQAERDLLLEDHHRTWWHAFDAAKCAAWESHDALIDDPVLTIDLDNELVFFEVKGCFDLDERKLPAMLRAMADALEERTEPCNAQNK